MIPDKPEKCPIPEEIWNDGISHCWGYVRTMDAGEKWDDSQCPCDYLSLDKEE